MAKPINLYQGPAPAAMSQMGAGLAEAGANIGRSLQQGYQSMGQGLASGMNAAVGEYAKYKDMNAQIKASEKSYNTIKDYLTPELRDKFDKQIEELSKDTNLSLRDKAAFWDQAKGTLGSFISQGFAMQKQKAELDASAARQEATEAAANKRAALNAQTQFDIEQLRQKYKAQQGSGVNFEMDPLPGSAGNSSSYYNSIFGE